MEVKHWHKAPKKFPAFGKEVQRKISRYEECYDCTKFYGKCKGQKKVKDEEFSCVEHKWLPRVNVK